MDQTSQAAAIAVAIAATGGVIGMLTVFARASRTPTATRARRPLVTLAPAQRPDVVAKEDVEAPVPADTTIVKQRGIPTNV